MCLGVPMQVKEIDGERARAVLGGVEREISLALVEGVNPGDYVLVHAGFAISVIDEATAEETLALLNEAYAAMERTDEAP